MCKLKPYTEAMDNRNVSVAFRFDFYSMPSFRNSFVEQVKSSFALNGFTERLLTEEEKQTINIDAVCDILDNSIEEMLSKKVYKLELTLPQDRASVDVYISPYFLYAHCSRKQNKELSWDELNKVFRLLKDNVQQIDLQNIACITVFQAEVGGKELWQVFDHDAFPTLDVETMTVGRYADSHQYDNIVAELVRIVKIGTCQQADGSEINPCYLVNITSIGNLQDKNSFLGDVPCEEVMKQLYEKSCEEATKCFK